MCRGYSESKKNLFSAYHGRPGVSLSILYVLTAVIFRTTQGNRHHCYLNLTDQGVQAQRELVHSSTDKWCQIYPGALTQDVLTHLMILPTENVLDG